MPVCPRCGKSLSSEQALNYHLNKKYKCGTWKCIKCNIDFETKFDLGIHEMNCNRNTLCSCPSYDILRTLYTELPFMLYELKNNMIKHVSPGCEKMIGFSQQELQGTIVSFKQKTDSMIEWVSKDKLIIRTYVKHIQDDWYIATI